MSKLSGYAVLIHGKLCPLTKIPLEVWYSLVPMRGIPTFYNCRGEIYPSPSKGFKVVKYEEGPHA